MSAAPPGDDGSVLASGEGIAVGARIAGYLVLDRIGRGGMAVVFRAQDERLGRVVALKVLAPVLAEDEAFRQRFIRESRVAATVDDPHIIPVFEAGEADGVLYIAMRYVPGGDVRSLVRREGPLRASRTASIVSPVASALDAAHAAGLVHRDVKPANMLIDIRSGRPDHVYLSDFGLSKGALSSVGLTGSGLFLGTPDYVSPEQIAGREVDGRADQYALACAAFEMLSGQPPFSRDHGMAVIYAHASEPPPALTARRPGLPTAVDAVLARALAKDPADRYVSCREFGESLREALELGPYDVESASRDAERPATVVVSQVPAGQAAGAGAGTIGAELALGIRKDESLTARAVSGDETLTAAARGAADSAQPEDVMGLAASPAEVSILQESADEDSRVSRPPTAPGDSSGPALSPAKTRRTRSLVIGAVSVVLVAGVAAAVAFLLNPSARGPQERSGHRANALALMTPVPGGRLEAVIAGPGRSAWAIGDAPGRSGLSQPLAERWDGRAWSRVPVPSISGNVSLVGAAAAPGGTVWAVGGFCPSACGNALQGYRTLVLHWDGTTWSRIPSPSPGGGAELSGVAGEQNGTALAVGCSPCANAAAPLILRWNGTSWSRIPSPGGSISPGGVAAGPGGMAWVVGDGSHVLRWNGATWTQVSTPSFSLSSVSIGSGGTAWAAGSTCCQGRWETVVLRWDGAKWSRVRSPSPGNSAVLWSVSTGPGGTAWAVGYYCNETGCQYGYSGFYGYTLILRWDGSAWTRVPSPSPGLKDDLNAVAVGQDGTTWAAGQTCISQCNTSSAQYQTLILRWNGTSWAPG